MCILGFIRRVMVLTIRGVVVFRRQSLGRFAPPPEFKEKKLKKHGKMVDKGSGV